MTDARTGIARRTLLGGGLAGAAGCQRPRPNSNTAAPRLSIRTLTASPPFLVGWRGGSRDWLEMTTYGFEQAAAIPERAIELGFEGIGSPAIREIVAMRR